VDPAFLTGLQSRMPDLMKHIEILPNVTTATNEMSSYRCAAVVYFKHPSKPAQNVYTVNEHGGRTSTGVERVPKDHREIKYWRQAASTYLRCIWHRIPFLRAVLGCT